MKYFLDTEFIEGFRKPLFGKRRHFIDLISIGIVAEDGRTYYAISNEYNYNDADDWVKENVIIPMYTQEISGDKRNHIDVEHFHKYIPNGKSNKRIAEEIVEFINNEPIITVGTASVQLTKDSVDNIRRGYLQPDFYGYYSDYDWVLFCSLFGRMIDLPKGFPMYCIDLKQITDEKSKILSYEQLSKLTYDPNIVKHNVYDYFEKTGEDKRGLIKRCINYPKQENEHNALSDAKWNKQLFEFLETL